MIQLATSGARKRRSDGSRTAIHIAVLVAVTGAVYFTNLGGAKLWDRDEPRNAACAREMLERNDWVTPYFNGELRTHKPVLTYWLMMSAYAVFGVTEFAARFWSAALGIGTMLATYVIARRLYSPHVGLWSALAMGTTLLFTLASRAATPDAVLIFFSTLSLAVYVVGTFRPKQHGERNDAPQTRVPGKLFPAWPVAALMYACTGVAVLAKGPVGLVLPTAVIGMFLLIMRLPRSDKSESSQAHARWSKWHTLAIIALIIELFLLDRAIGPLKTFAALGISVIAYAIFQPGSLCRKLVLPFAPQHFLKTCWSMRPLTAIGVVLAVAGPWYFWVGLRTDGAWLQGFFLEHNFGRATQTFEGHGGTFLFYPVSVLAGCFPWSILLPAGLAATAQRIRGRNVWLMSDLLGACWAGVTMGLFTLAKTKLPSYITPAYPALAMMIGVYVVLWIRAPRRVNVWTPRLAFAALAIAGIGIGIALPLAAREFLAGEIWLGTIALIPLAAAACGFDLARQQKPRAAAACLAASAALLLIAGFAIVGPVVSQHQPIVRALQRIEAASSEAKIASHRSHEPSWVFYAGRPIPVIGTQQPQNAGEFLRDPDAFLITNDRAIDNLQPHLPPDVQPIARERFFLKKYDLVVLGRTPAGVRLARQQAATELRVAGEESTIR
mgnify:CR=1 FL=1